MRAREDSCQWCCVNCYTWKWQDSEFFGGLHETALERDGYRCRICDAPGGCKREMIVHHRVPGKPVLAVMPGFIAPRAVLKAWPRLLLKLWREQYPTGHEQTTLDFTTQKAPAKLVPLFDEEREQAHK